MKQNIFFIFFIVMVLLVPTVLAAQEHLGTFKINSCFDLTQNCGNCTFVNISAVYYPNGSIAEANLTMAQSGSMFSRQYCNTSFIGTYIVNGVGNADGNKVFAYDFMITDSGSELYSGVSSIPIALFILIINISMFALFFKKKIVENKYTNFIIRRSALVVAIFLLMFNASIMATIASSAGLPLTQEMFLYMRYFGWGGYITIIFLCFSTIVQLFAQYKTEKHNRRYGE